MHAPSDDGSSGAVALAGGAAGGFPMGVLFFGNRYTQIYVNTNGSVTFGGPLAAVNHGDLPRYISTPFIAPWFAQVDTSPGTQPGDPAGANRVYYDLRTNQFTATWYLVGYDNAHTNLRNSFQVIIRQLAGGAAGEIEIEFRYNQCQWISGDDDGGTGGRGGSPAQAGMAEGDGTNWFTLPGSLTFMADTEICRGSNVASSGVYRFRADRVNYECDNGYWEWPEACDYGPTSPICMDCGLVMSEQVGEFNLMFLDGGRDAGPDGGDGGGGGGDIDGGGGGNMDGGGRDGGGGGRFDSGPPRLDAYGGGCSAGGGGAPGIFGIGIALACLLRRRSRAR
jgi:hypothetical protein